MGTFIKLLKVNSKEVVSDKIPIILIYIRGNFVYHVYQFIVLSLKIPEFKFKNVIFSSICSRRQINHDSIATNQGGRGHGFVNYTSPQIKVPKVYNNHGDFY